MKIGILGTRGIPNNYGGFEQCAEILSKFLVKEGHEVTVYCTDEHPYDKDEWNGIKIKKVYSNEKKLKLFGTIIYDYLCLKDAVKRDFDIILELGYNPDAPFYYLKNKTKAKLITNMDGLDWNRSKFNALIRGFIKFCEGIAVRKSDYLIADNVGIKNYIWNRYKKESHFIPYGAELFHEPVDKYLSEYGIEKYSYSMLIARLEPENNIIPILDGYVKSGKKDKFLVFGNHNTKYGTMLKERYKNSNNIIFTGAVYNYELLSTLRWYTKIYFHGHSVGGTNPSLLEAMASNAFICAHDNEFNRDVIGKNGLFFKDSNEVASIVNNLDEELRESFIENNRKKIEDVYTWERVSRQYLDLFEEALKR